MKQQSKTKTPYVALEVTRIRAAGPDHHVITFEGGKRSYRRKPCATCPWRIDATGEFHPECFRHTAATAYENANPTFACHESGARKPALCAGFLLRGANHNLSVQLKMAECDSFGDVNDGGHELHANFRVMAIANGVSPDDPVLVACRD